MLTLEKIMSELKISSVNEVVGGARTRSRRSRRTRRSRRSRNTRTN